MTEPNLVDAQINVRPIDWLHAQRGQIKAGPVRSILTAIAVRCNGQGRGYASNRTISEDLLIHVKTVDRHMPAVKATGWILELKRGWRGSATEYQLIIPGRTNPRSTGLFPYPQTRETAGYSDELTRDSVQLTRDIAGTRGTTQEPLTNRERETQVQEPQMTAEQALKLARSALPNGHIDQTVQATSLEATGDGT